MRVRAPGVFGQIFKKPKGRGFETRGFPVFFFVEWGHFFVARVLRVRSLAFSRVFLLWVMLVLAKWFNF